MSASLNALRIAGGSARRNATSIQRLRRVARRQLLDHYVAAVRRWRSAAHDKNVGLLVVIDGDEKGILKRRQELAQRLRDAQAPPIQDTDRAAIVIPTWHIETWIAWLCGHRPIDERTRYKPDDALGALVGRRIRSGAYGPRGAIEAWVPPLVDEQRHVPSIADARRELSQHLGV